MQFILFTSKPDQRETGREEIGTKKSVYQCNCGEFSPSSTLADLGPDKLQKRKSRKTLENSNVQTSLS